MNAPILRVARPTDDLDALIQGTVEEPVKPITLAGRRLDFAGAGPRGARSPGGPRPPRPPRRPRHWPPIPESASESRPKVSKTEVLARLGVWVSRRYKVALRIKYSVAWCIHFLLEHLSSHRRRGELFSCAHDKTFLKAIELALIAQKAKLSAADFSRKITELQTWARDLQDLAVVHSRHVTCTRESAIAQIAKAALPTITVNLAQTVC